MLLSNRSSQYQNQYTLVNRDGQLRLGTPRRHILAMPPELLAEIFFCAVDPDPAHAPLLLCAVCRQWRRIALTTPKLWNSIYFHCDRWAIFVSKSEAEEAALYVELFRDWIARARSTPLSLQLYATVREGVGSVVDSLLEIIGGVSQQWQNIDIDIGRDLPLPFLGDGKYPLLEKLNISSLPPDRSVLSFRDAPRLRDVFIPTYTTRIELPWHQLTKFGTERMNIETCLDLLRHASNLVDAHLRILPYDASTLPQTVFSLPQLHSLNLSGAWDDDDEDMPEMMPLTLLKSLKAPALKTLASRIISSTPSRIFRHSYHSFPSPPFNFTLWHYPSYRIPRMP